jgi:hypothetical protein
MKDQKHSQAPWHAALFRTGPIYYAVDKTGKDVASVYGATEEQIKANASLIVAAPEMLAALERADEVFARLCPDRESRYGEAWTGIEAAIAKAKGAR